MPHPPSTPPPPFSSNLSIPGVLLCTVIDGHASLVIVIVTPTHLSSQKYYFVSLVLFIMNYTDYTVERGI